MGRVLGCIVWMGECVGQDDALSSHKPSTSARTGMTLLDCIQGSPIVIVCSVDNHLPQVNPEALRHALQRSLSSVLWYSRHIDS